MLHCRGGVFYTGHTDNLPHRIAQHETGAIPGFTSDKLPVKLVWSQEFSTRIEALEAERRIKGWSRAKKLALIRGDWDRISALAKGKSGPSTSSGQTEKEMPAQSNTVRPELVEACPERLACPAIRKGLHFALQPHRDTPPSRVRSVAARIWMSDPNKVLIEFSVEGAEMLSIPAWVSPARRDGLWRTTCFELFLKCANGRYYEFNFSPSTEWAAYSFDSYRSGMTALALDIEPHIEISRKSDTFSVECDIDLGQIPTGGLTMALSAVIEEEGGSKSYWALAHPQRDAPDFHDPACFAASLPAPRNP